MIVQPAKQGNVFSCDSVSMQLVGKIQGSKVSNDEFYSQTLELQGPSQYDALSRPIPFQLTLDLPISSF